MLPCHFMGLIVQVILLVSEFAIHLLPSGRNLSIMVLDYSI